MHTIYFGVKRLQVKVIGYSSYELVATGMKRVRSLNTHIKKFYGS